LIGCLLRAELKQQYEAVVSRLVAFSQARFLDESVDSLSHLRPW
jgi:hypothetical protein